MPYFIFHEILTCLFGFFTENTLVNGEAVMPAPVALSVEPLPAIDSSDMLRLTLFLNHTFFCCIVDYLQGSLCYLLCCQIGCAGVKENRYHNPAID